MKLIYVCLILGLSGCVTMPRQTQEMNVILGNQIAESKRMTFGLIDQWEQESRARVETFMRYHWVRQFIVKFLDYPAVKDAMDKVVCEDRGKLDRAVVIQELVEDISAEVESKRRELLGAIETEGGQMRRLAAEHFEDTERMHRLIGANIASVVKGQEFEKQIREAIAKPIKEIIPVDSAREKLDKMMEPINKITIWNKIKN